MADEQPGPLVDPSTVPDWLAPLVSGIADIDARRFRRRTSPNGSGHRDASVLMLFGHQEHGPDVLLLRRSDTLGSHPGQVAFPGGGAEPDDDGPVGTALREAVEEVGVDPAGVRPVALLPKLYVPVSGFDVTPVLAHWTNPSAVHAVDPAETAAVARVPVAHLTDPANRLRVRHHGGYLSPAYLFPGMLIWGFTAGLLTALLDIAGWDRPWDQTVVRGLDEAWRVAGELDTPPPGTLPAADAEVRQ